MIDCELLLCYNGAFFDTKSVDGGFVDENKYESW